MIRIRIKQFLMFVLSIIGIINKRKLSEKSDSATNLIIMHGAIGDSLLFFDSLKAYIEISQTTIIVCRKQVMPFVNMFFGTDSKIKIMEIELFAFNYPRFFDYIKLIVKLRKFVFNQVIITSFDSWVYEMVVWIKSKDYFGYFFHRPQVNKPIIKFITKNLHFKTVIGEANDFVGRDYEQLIRKIGLSNYRSCIFKDEKKEDIYDSVRINKSDSYFIIAPTAYATDRYVTPEQCIKIINYLTLKWEYRVLVCGMDYDKIKIDYIISKLDNKNKVLNYAGKTKLIEYYHLIGNAIAIIGADSGSIHMAAIQRVPSIVLCGYWGGKFLPYDYETIENYYPICVFSRKKYECTNCLDYGNRGCLNNVCMTLMKDGSCLCLSEININDVYSAIDKVMSHRK